MQGTIKILNSSGHTAVEYDTETGVVEEAEKILRQAQASSSAFFDGKTKERIGGPQTGTPKLSEHEEILVVPPMAGG